MTICGQGRAVPGRLESLSLINSCVGSNSFSFTPFKSTKYIDYFAKNISKCFFLIILCLILAVLRLTTLPRYLRSLTIDVQQNKSNENQQVLAVFDSLLPMVCGYFYIKILFSYTVVCLHWYITFTSAHLSLFSI